MFIYQSTHLIGYVFYQSKISEIFVLIGGCVFQFLYILSY